MKVGFIGLGNVGAKLSGSLLRNGVDLTIRDLDKSLAEPFLAMGAKWADSPKEMMEACDAVITCLPSPAASAAVDSWKLRRSVAGSSGSRASTESYSSSQG